MVINITLQPHSGHSITLQCRRKARRVISCVVLSCNSWGIRYAGLQIEGSTPLAIPFSCNSSCQVGSQLCLSSSSITQEWAKHARNQSVSGTTSNMCYIKQQRKIWSTGKCFRVPHQSQWAYLTDWQKLHKSTNNNSRLHTTRIYLCNYLKHLNSMWLSISARLQWQPGQLASTHTHPSVDESVSLTMNMSFMQELSHMDNFIEKICIALKNKTHEPHYQLTVHQANVPPGNS